MGKAKDIQLRPIPAAQANELVKRIHYSGKAAPRRVLVSTNPDYPVFAGGRQDSRLLSPAPNRTAVAAGDGSLFWQDPAQELLWVKLTPLGLAAPGSGVVPGADRALDRAFALRIEP